MAFQQSKPGRWAKKRRDKNSFELQLEKKKTELSYSQ